MDKINSGTNYVLNPLISILNCNTVYFKKIIVKNAIIQKDIFYFENVEKISIELLRVEGLNLLGNLLYFKNNNE